MSLYFAMSQRAYAFWLSPVLWRKCMWNKAGIIPNNQIVWVSHLTFVNKHKQWSPSTLVEAMLWAGNNQLCKGYKSQFSNTKIIWHRWRFCLTSSSWKHWKFHGKPKFSTLLAYWRTQIWLKLHFIFWSPITVY